MTPPPAPRSLWALYTRVRAASARCASAAGMSVAFSSSSAAAAAAAAAAPAARVGRRLLVSAPSASRRSPRNSTSSRW